MKSLFPNRRLLPVGLILAVVLLTLKQTPLHSVVFQDEKSSSGEAPQTRGAGTRPGKCGGEEIRQKFYALTPPSNILRTVAPNPTLYIYTPAIRDKKAEFWLFEETEQEIIYETRLSLSHAAGILKIAIPNKVTLQPNRQYLWELFVICNPEDRGDDETITGIVERIEIPTPTSDRPLERAEYYAREGIWQQALEILLGLRESNPREWREFLKSADLETYADTPLID